MPFAHGRAVSRCPRSTNFAFTIVWLMIVCIGLSIETTIAQEKPEDQTPIAELRKDVPDSTSDEDHAAKLKIDAEKMKKATALLAAVGGIAILGVGVIAATMLGAKHLRRLARNPGPPQKTAGNDFWFLKPPKPIASDTDIADSHRPPHIPPEQETSE
jgi:hypothetical protein